MVAYEGGLVSPFHARSPKFTFAHKHPRAASTPTPGPGAYEPPPRALRTNHGVIGSSAQRPTSPGPLAPGPGAYESTDALFVSNAGTFPSAGRTSSSVKAQASDTPGPGSYRSASEVSLASLRSVPFTKASRFQPDAEKVSPGPAAYQPDTHDLGGHCVPEDVGFGTANRPRPREERPTPHCYDLGIPSVGGGAPAYTIPSGRRASPASNGPGPGAYAQPSATPRGCRFPASARTSREPPPTPGPGSFNTSNELSHRASPRRVPFGKAKRFDDIQNTSPGPSYTPADGMQRVHRGPANVGFGTAPKVQSGRLRTDTPGPASYVSAADLLSPRTSPRRATFGKDRRFDSKQRSLSPGPAAYSQVDLSASGYAHPSNVGFGTSSRPKSPLPGASPLPHCYDTELKWSGPSHTMPSGRKDPAPPDVPGPGAYAPAEAATLSACGVTFGSQRRGAVSPRSRRESPGPGAYGHSSEAGRGSPGRGSPGRELFARARRFDKWAEGASPGPAAYTPSEAKLAVCCSSSPRIGFSRSRRSADLPSGSSPGPGSHDPQVPKPTLPKWSFSKKPKDAAADPTPAPGDYPGANFTTIG